MDQPLYKKIYLDLERDIASGKYLPGSQLPTEKELSDFYQVSRITSKRALAELEQSGFIYRTRGKGSFVANKPIKAPKKANRILFLLPFLNDLSVGNFTEGLSPIMQDNQIDIMMTTLDYLHQKNADEIIGEFDGLIYYAQNTDSFLDLFAELALKDFPVILLDKKIYDLPFPVVISDNIGGGYAATKFLIHQGHERIAYLFGEEIHPQSVRQRYLGYIQAIKEAKLSFHTPIDEKRANNQSLLEYVKDQHITALVCENDITAIMSMKLLKEAGYAIPEDISVIGFDDIQAASLIDPPLTTIAQNFKKLGQIAGGHLIQWIEKNERPSDVQIPVNLIERQSTKEISK